MKALEKQEKTEIQVCHLLLAQRVYSCRMNDSICLLVQQFLYTFLEFLKDKNGNYVNDITCVCL